MTKTQKKSVDFKSQFLPSMETLSPKGARLPLANLSNAPSSYRFFVASDSDKPKPKYSGGKSSVSSAGSGFVAEKSSLIQVSGVPCGIKSCFLIDKRTSQPAITLQHAEEKHRGQKDDSNTAVISCPPLGRPHRLRNNSLAKHNSTNKNDACSELCRQKKKRRHCMQMDEAASLREFIRKQRAHFEEVDSFELAEETVSETELDQ